MMKAPDLAAISVAELKLAQSVRNTRDGLYRVRVAFRGTLARASTLVLVGGAAGLLGIWLAPRRPAQVESSSHGVAATASAAGLALAFIARYGMVELIRFILEHFWAAWHKRAGPARPER